ncbi:MAG: hypothetical protein HYW89_04685 [Candidatus Sungiibacteriota bacterium]|uniref:DUF4383 domain-containing protein n=1 Tax=Candidatus Sungiibacteriota bacterium TaxID=2750080 RepID=A0A7T5RJE4_9BACT|nr:MAG: hypothetical protein HYW89_04685 [Candidatus Sungbacteria bacterium]
MNPATFLKIGGIVLIAVGVLGLIGIIGPTAESSIFGSTWWFDNAENWAHIVLGIVALIVVFALKGFQKIVTLVVGILGVVVGIWGFVLGANFFGAGLETLDNLLHLVIGLWALWSWKNAKEAGMPMAMPQRPPMGPMGPTGM